MDDWDLLEQFRVTRSERAFGELVRRHAGFVLAACRRRLRDGHDAEDAAQAVFLVLARRPPARSGSTRALAGWLYQTAMYACNNAMRAQRTRDRHVRSAAAQRAAAASDERPRIGEGDLLLDQALAALSGKDRDAILLRFYQDKSVQEVGASLGISANTATKRIARALARMRRSLAGNGLAIAPPALVESISGAMCAPVASGEFVARTIAIGTGQSAAPAAVQHIAQGVDVVIRLAKLKLAAAVVVAVVTTCGGALAMNRLTQDARPPATPPAQASAAEPAKGEDPSRPATRSAEPGADDFDISTPKGALRTFARASRAADFETLARVSKTDLADDLESALIGATNSYQKSMGELFVAVREKFGDAEVRKFSRQRGAIPLEPFLRLIEAELDQHDVVQEGETARLVDRRDPNTPTNVKLQRENGVWKVASTGLLAQFGEEQIMRRLEMLQHRAEIVRGVAEEVKEGKYENIEAVGTGLAEALRR
jgi:RNA polymerase sigma factor (sigma-70 family)